MQSKWQSGNARPEFKPTAELTPSTRVNTENGYIIMNKPSRVVAAGKRMATERETSYMNELMKLDRKKKRAAKTAFRSRKEVLDLKVCEIYSPPAVESTSINSRMAYDFGSQWNSSRPVGTMFEIRNPKGATAIEKNPGEMVFIMMPPTKMKA